MLLMLLLKVDSSLYYCPDHGRFLIGYWYHPAACQFHRITWGLDDGSYPSEDTHGDYALGRQGEFNLPDAFYKRLDDGDGVTQDEIIEAAVQQGWCRLTVWSQITAPGLEAVITAATSRLTQQALIWATRRHPEATAADIDILAPDGTWQPHRLNGDALESLYQLGRLPREARRR
jgi:hypothetical protein